MNLKFRVATMGCVILLTGTIAVAETSVGIGTVIGFSTNMNLPIRTDNLLIEPYISYYDRDIDRPDSENTYTNDDRRVLEVGTGLFRRWRLGVDAPMYQYLGLRIGYINVHEEQRYVYDNSSAGTRKMQTNGYLLAPVIGLEYFAARSASVSTELAIRYENETGDMTINGTKYNGIDETYIYGRATVVFRYYVN